MIQNPGNSNNHHTGLLSTTSEIKENDEMENSDNQTFSSNQEVKLSINGVQFTISNQKRNGENVINMELRVANDSSCKQGTINNNQQTSDVTKERKVNSSDDCARSDNCASQARGVSINWPNNMAALPQSREIRNEITDASSSSERKQVAKKLVVQTKIRNSETSIDTGSVKDQHEPQSIKCRKRKLPMEEIDSSENCRVCGDEASKFIHYGGRSCQSCRAFFRRTVEKQSL